MVHASTLCIGKDICPGYQLRRLRGRGGFASVWEATKPDGAVIALKFLPCKDSAAATQEIRSVQLVRNLHHRSLVRIDQVWGHRGYVVVTMELADGSLSDLLEAYQQEYRRPLDPVDVCDYLGQVADALDYLNSHRHAIDGQLVGIQHCDVKPNNILLFGDLAKLSDFGLASPTTTPLKHHRRAGTLAYAAPEIFQGRLSDWTDQYALAVTYCQLRSGRLPFADTPSSFRSGYVRPAPDLSMLTADERPVIARALAPTPPERWRACSELVDQLARLVG